MLSPRSLLKTPEHGGQRFLSADHWIEFFRTYYGPTLKAFAALDDAG
jgi:hypothetical protein